ncbi:hypothetical protein ABET51_11270 [Metabacillus fastidiosus]|uniref:DUF7668 domain-containing protein n=1 Tax=Metabacillus fastidiosus TaxID=1458 RepID=UPI002E22B15C|nr:hypothetical protein [Metabacillus fastidiosus]
MNIEKIIEQLAKESMIDLFYLHYDKLKAENILNEENEKWIKEIIELNGEITFPSTDMEIEADIYEYNDGSGFGVEIPIVLGEEGAELSLFFEARTNTEKTEVIQFYIEAIDIN